MGLKRRVLTARSYPHANLRKVDFCSVCDLNHRWPARPRRMAAAHLTAVTSVALHVGADLLVAGDAMGRCTVHRFSTGAFLAELALRGVGRERATVRHVVIAGDGSVAAALHGTDDSSCVLQSWSAAGGEWVRHGSMRLASVVCGMTDTTSGLLVVCRSSAALRCIKTLGVLRALAVRSPNPYPTLAPGLALP